MNKSKTNFCLNLSLLLLLLAAFFSAGLGYFRGEVEKASASIVSSKKEIRLLSEKNKRLAVNKARFTALTAEADAAFATLVDKGRTVEFITAMEETAAADQVKLRMAVAPDKNGLKAGDFVSSSKFTVTAAGSFAGLMHFLYALENFRYEADIANLRISYGDFDQYNKDLIVLTFDLELYQKNSAK